MEFTAEIRPFINRAPIAYELVLVRRDGERWYDKRIAILSGTDAKDLIDAVTSSGIRLLQSS